MRARGHGKKTGRGGEEVKEEKVKENKGEGTQFVRLVCLVLRLVPTSKNTTTKNMKEDKKREPVKARLLRSRHV